MIAKLILGAYALIALLPGNTIKAKLDQNKSSGPIDIVIFEKPPDNEILKTLANPIRPVYQPLVRAVEPTQAVLSSKPSIAAIKAAIVKWAAYYSVSSGLLLRIADCESSFNPNAVNRSYYAGGGNPSGIFQFLPSTFTRYASSAGIVNPNVFNYEHNIQAAAYAFSHGGASEWECK